MLRVKYRDRGPLVVAIQVLLNRHGNKLVVDGVYGKKTKDAVWDFQRRQPGISRDGDVGRQTWPLLSRGSGLQVLDATDVCDPGIRDNNKERKDYWKIQSVDVTCRKDGVVYAIGQIIAKARSPKSIVLLRFWGHGVSARFHLGSGEGRRAPIMTPITRKPLWPPRSPTAEDVLSLRTFDHLRPHLVKLKPHFASFGSVEFHGCSIAKRAAGKTFIERLAWLWGVPVRASKDDTVGSGSFSVLGADGVKKANPDIRMEMEARGNDLIVVYPNGLTPKAWASLQAQQAKQRRIPALAR